MTQHRFAAVLLFIALGHALVGILLFSPYLIQIPARGWVNSVGPSFLEGSVAVWFLMFTWPLLLIVIQFWGNQTKVKNRFSECAILGSLIGISLMPVSGFWLMLVLGIFARLNRNQLRTAQ